MFLLTWQIFVSQICFLKYEWSVNLKSWDPLGPLCEMVLPPAKKKGSTVVGEDKREFLLRFERTKIHVDLWRVRVKTGWWD